MNHLVKLEDPPFLIKEMVLVKLALQLAAETFSYLAEEIEVNGVEGGLLLDNTDCGLRYRDRRLNCLDVGGW